MSALTSEIALGLALVALLLLLGGAVALERLIAGRGYGRLTYVDTGGPSEALRSFRYRLVGRPDEVRTLSDGRSVPVEWKSSAPPTGGPHPSHRTQVLAYCLLLEESTGRPPPFGVVRYRDGSEFRLAWDDDARSRLLSLLAELRRPYDGRARPAPRKCAGCRYRSVCDARAA